MSKANKSGFYFSNFVSILFYNVISLIENMQNVFSSNKIRTHEFVVINGCLNIY